MFMNDFIVKGNFVLLQFISSFKSYLLHFIQRKVHIKFERQLFFSGKNFSNRTQVLFYIHFKIERIVFMHAFVRTYFHIFLRPNFK